MTVPNIGNPHRRLARLSSECLSECSCPIFQIDTQEDADRLVDCPTINGTLLFGETASGKITFPNAKIISRITAQYNNFLTAIESPKVESIEQIYIRNCSELTSLQFPSLRTYGSIGLDQLSKLQTVSLSSDSLQPRDDLPISIAISKTLITSLKDWIPSLPSNITELEVEDNPQLNEIDVANIYIAGWMAIKNNGPSLKLNFSNLSEAMGIDLSNVQLEEFPVLRNVSEYLNITGISNSKLNFPKLNQVSVNVEIVGNRNLTTLTMPNLTNVDFNLSISDNPSLEINEESLGGLRYVGGEVIINARLSG
jgi:hypothetical protein